MRIISDPRIILMNRVYDVFDVRSGIFVLQYFYSLSLSLLIIYISVRLFRDSWIGLDWLRNKQRTKVLIN